MCLNAVNRPSRAFVYDYFRDNKVIPDVFSFTNRGSSAERIEQYPTVLLEDDVENPDDGAVIDLGNSMKIVQTVDYFTPTVSYTHLTLPTNREV